ncbi:MAG: pilus assembly protein PilM, partial [Candidatus Sumerlaeaceae bacterium]|nr:pilus assembly protein PilM [Candidatus Sumerlaeaceae bacterium]
MQQLRKCLGIDIGTTTVKVAEMVSEKSGVRVTKLLSKPLGLSPGPLDDERMAAIIQCVKDIIKENKIATKEAVFSLPGQNVFVRQITVPRTSDERLRRIVQYEARQQIPFALENSVMEFQVFDLGDPAEVKVLLAAVKKDIVLEFMKLINKLGLKPVQISVSSLALLNFYIFDATPFGDMPRELSASVVKRDQPEGAVEEEKADDARAAKATKKKGFDLAALLNFGKKKKKPAGPPPGAEDFESLPEMNMDEPVDDVYEMVPAYVNIGASTFDLVISRFGKFKMLGFPRSVPWGGNELSRTLQEKLGLESLDAAEELKRERAHVVVPGQEELVAEQGGDPEASEFTTTWADRLILDLRKSFDYYISQPDGMAVDSITLSGGQAVQPNLAPYIEEKLGIPVDIKSAVANESLKLPEITSSNGIGDFLVVLGLGLTGIGLGKLKVDFLPSELKTIREFKKKNVEVFLLLGAIAGMVAVSTQVGSRDIDNMSNWLNQQKSQIDQVNTVKVQAAEAEK